jgi:hypothetical protein
VTAAIVDGAMVSQDGLVLPSRLNTEPPETVEVTDTVVGLGTV